MKHTYNSEFCPACNRDICVTRRRAYPEIFDEDLDTDGIDPVAVVSTGFTPSEGATELQIFYIKGRTVVVPCGEAFNCGPLVTEGEVPVAEVLDDYRRELTVELVGFEDWS